MEEERRWEDLGVDCLANIFSRLPVDDLLLSVPFVCKPWLDASADAQCWKVLDLRDIDGMPWSTFGAKFNQLYKTKRFSLTRFMNAVIDRGHGETLELAFPTERFASLKDLQYASINCPKLKVLGLPNLFQQEERRIPEFIEKWKDLEFLAMGKKPSSFTQIIEQISVNCKNFKGLQLSGYVSDSYALAIVKHLPKLKYLVMSGCSVSKSGLLVILHGCKELEAVDVSGCRGFDAADGEILKTASSVKAFKCEGAETEADYARYYSHHCDELYYSMVCH